MLQASILWLALQRAGVVENAAIYDEVRFCRSPSCSSRRLIFIARSQSWTGYAARPESVIEKS